MVYKKKPQRITTTRPTEDDLARIASAPSMYGDLEGMEPINRGGSSHTKILKVVKGLEKKEMKKAIDRRVRRKNYNQAQIDAIARLVPLEHKIKAEKEKVKHCEIDKARLHRLKQTAAAERKVIAGKTAKRELPPLTARQKKLLNKK